MSDEHEVRAVVAALGANVGIAVLKFLAFGITGSSSMLAEGVHSVADSGNQLLLLVGRRRSGREPTPQHPFGYGRDRYIAAFLVALVLFSLGGLFALYEGWHKISHPHAIEDWPWAIGVLLGAVCLEAFSFHTGVRQSNRVRGGASWIQFIRRAKAPELPVVLLEDSAALLGLAAALAGVSAAVVTGDGRWDGAGTLAIGVLLVSVATVLGIETKSLLLGEAASRETVQAICDALVDGTMVPEVIHLRTLHLAPDELLVAAKIAVNHDDTAAEVARAIDEAEARVRTAVPIARVIYLEPDILRR